MPKNGVQWIFLTALTVLTVGSMVRLGLTYLRRGEADSPRMVKVAGIPKELDTRELKILNFYTADKPVRGEPFIVCYGVLNAVAVTLEPPLAEVAPTLNRCVEVTIRKETELTLTATGKDGETAVASFVIGVSEPRPEFKFVSTSSREIRAGEKFTLCYGVRNATKVRLEPGGQALPPGEKTCFWWYPAQAPLRLIAESPGGREEVPLPLKIKR